MAREVSRAATRCLEAVWEAFLVERIGDAEEHLIG